MLAGESVCLARRVGISRHLHLSCSTVSFLSLASGLLSLFLLSSSVICLSRLVCSRHVLLRLQFIYFPSLASPLSVSLSLLVSPLCLTSLSVISSCRFTASILLTQLVRLFALPTMQNASSMPHSLYFRIQSLLLLSPSEPFRMACPARYSWVALVCFSFAFVVELYRLTAPFRSDNVRLRRDSVCFHSCNSSYST